MFKNGIVLGTLIALVLSSAALAQPRGIADRELARHHPRKDRACVAECRAETVDCLKAARAAAAPCFESCQPLVEAAREACAADPDGEACELATRAARACLEPCHEILRPAVRACIADGHACVRACPFVGEPPCLTECRGDHIDCLQRANAALVECRRGCGDELKAAREACAADSASEACLRATRAAHACLRPCRERYAAHVQTCQAALRACVADCDAEGDAAD
jgi:hypothetical protein